MSPEGLMIGVDIGGTTIKSGVVSAHGKILERISVLTPNAGSKEIAKLVASQVQILLATFPGIKKVGVGVPGALDPDRTHVHYPPNLPKWKVEPFPAYLSAELPGFPVEVDNDANAATLAEATFGAGKGENYFLLATLGTGVGGGIWSDGKIYRGAYGGAGEFGHISIAYNGEKCNCGAEGCIEAYIGKEYLIRRTLRKLEDKNIKSRLRDIASDKHFGVKKISEAAEAGDAFAKEVLAEAGMMLGQAFASVAKLLDIRTFIVSGGVAEAGELITRPARESLRANVFSNQRDTVKLLESKLGIHSGIVGAALVGILY